MEELAPIPATAAAVITPAPITALVAQQFINYIDASPQSVATYRASIKRLLQYLADNGITSPQRYDIIAYRDYLKANYKPATTALHMTAARLFFRWIAQQGYYPNVADHIKGAKLDRGHKKDYLTADQVKQVISGADRASITGKRDFAILSLMVTTGLRCIEISRANIEDLGTAGGDAVLYVQGKGREEKTDYVKLAAPIEKAIREYLATRGKATGKEPLFISDSNNSRGARITTRSISRLVKNHMIQAGYNSDRLTAHSLRHTAATLNLLNGGTPEETQQLLRHININTTLIYSHALERAANNSESRIASAIFQ